MLDILCQRSHETLQLIYQFLDEPWFEHDFDNIDYAVEEFDSQMNTPDLYSVRWWVEWAPRNTILPPDLPEQLANLAFWRARHNTRVMRINQKT